MTILERLPLLKSFFGLRLFYGALFTAILGAVGSTTYMALHISEKNFDWPKNMFAFMSTLLLMFSVILIAGIWKRKEELCMLWVWCALSFLVPYLVLILMLACKLIAMGQFWVTWTTLAGILGFTVFGYLVLVVNSYRHELLVKQMSDEGGTAACDPDCAHCTC